MKKRTASLIALLTALTVLFVFLFPAAASAAQTELNELDYGNLTDFENALRGRVAQLDPPVVYLGGDESAQKIWDLSRYDFIPDVNKPEDYVPENPETIDKSLWRQAQLNKIHGLFEVSEGVYQVRGYDLANMTIIEGSTGVIIIDCMNTSEGADAALKLYSQYKGKDVKVKGVIITHSHADHYGGILGVLKHADKDIDVFAPEGFMEAVILENAFVGDAMTRRSTFMYGTLLPQGEDGQVDAGLGKAVANGSVTLVAPTVTVTEKNLNHTIDGVTVNFLLFPGTEAPAEMTIYLPAKRLLVAAELSTHTLHNILTPRGAEVRDTRAWWKALDTLLTEYGNRLEVICSTHHWPTWGKEECVTLLKQQRDTYKFLHDQTIRLINKGYTMLEIAEEFEKPGFLPDFMYEWFSRGYYGTISHDVRAIYQKYIGWYDMNPSNLNPLPPEEAAKEYVEAFGGETATAALVENALASDDLRWAAELGKHLVFNNPSKENRELLAKAYEKLGYESEASTWRNMYLTGAAELRKGGPLRIMTRSTVNPATLEAMGDELLFDFIAGRFMAEEARGVGFSFDIVQTDRGITYNVESSGNGVLNFHVKVKSAEPAETVLKLDRSTFVKLILKTDGYTLSQAVEEGNAVVSGEASTVNEFFELIEISMPNFNIVQP